MYCIDDLLTIYDTVGRLEWQRTELFSAACAKDSVSCQCPWDSNQTEVLLHLSFPFGDSIRLKNVLTFKTKQNCRRESKLRPN